jgi:hypothetical protein
MLSSIADGWFPMLAAVLGNMWGGSVSLRLRCSMSRGAFSGTLEAAGVEITPVWFGYGRPVLFRADAKLMAFTAEASSSLAVDSCS